MPLLNLAGCPHGVRFVILKLESIDFWHSKVNIVHSYIGPIELDRYYSEGALVNCRILPRPIGGSESKYHWSEPSRGEMWEEALSIEELKEYLDD